MTISSDNKSLRVKQPPREPEKNASNLPSMMLRRYLTYGAIVIVISLFIKVLIASPADIPGELAFIKSALRPVWNVYLSIFGNPLSGLLLSMLMIAVLAWQWANFWLGLVVPTRQTLAGVAAAVRTHTGADSDAAILAGMRAAMQSTPLLADDWKAFEATLIHRYDGTRTRLYSSSRPSAYFSLQSLHRHGVRLRAYNPVGSYFVGAGLMLTFMGLVAGLYFASRGMKTADLNEARNSLVQLLNASTFKFMTSISGILSSILFTIVVRAGTEDIDQRLHVLVRAIEAHAPLITTELIMQDQIEEARRQITCMTKLDSSLQYLAATIKTLVPSADQQSRQPNHSS